jgi:hypothetical protein
MRSIVVIFTVASLAVGPSFAQNTKSSDPEDPGKKALPRLDYDKLNVEPGPPGIKTTEGNNPGAPAAGANSFTEDQAKARIEERGYTNVSELKKDEKGIWQGTAETGGKKVQVSLDFQGNVVVH